MRSWTGATSALASVVRIVKRRSSSPVSGSFAGWYSPARRSSPPPPGGTTSAAARPSARSTRKSRPPAPRSGAPRTPRGTSASSARSRPARWEQRRRRAAPGEAPREAPGPRHELSLAALRAQHRVDGRGSDVVPGPVERSRPRSATIARAVPPPVAPAPTAASSIATRDAKSGTARVKRAHMTLRLAPSARLQGASDVGGGRMVDSFGTKSTLTVQAATYTYYKLASLAHGRRFARAGSPSRSAFSSRTCSATRTAASVTRGARRGACSTGTRRRRPTQEIAFHPARVLLQDFTGVPAVVDLAAMREAIDAARRRPAADQPARSPPTSSSTTRCRSTSSASSARSRSNAELEYERNSERYALPPLGRSRRSTNFRVVPPEHRHLPPGQPRVPGQRRHARRRTSVAYPDTLVGTDSHTTMINGLGVLGWGVGGIEAEAAMLGQPLSMLIPQVVGFKLDRHAARGRHRHRPGAHRHPDAAQEERGRQVRRVLRPRPRRALAARPRHHRQHGARVRRHHGLLPRRRGDARLPALHRPPEGAGRARRGLLQGAGPLPHRGHARPGLHATRSSSTSATVEPSLAGPKRPQDRVPLADVKTTFRDALTACSRRTSPPSTRPRSKAWHAGAAAERATRSSSSRHASHDGDTATTLGHGSVVIAAITSCTNTSNPAVMLGAGLLAKKAVERGLTVEAVGEDLARARLQGGHRLSARRGAPAVPRGARLPPRRLRLHDLHRQLGPAARRGRRRGDATSDLVVASVLSGNRNFEGRINPQVRMNFLASPPLVVAYALARRRRHRPRQASRIGTRSQRRAGLPQGHLADARRGAATPSQRRCKPEQFAEQYANVVRRRRGVAEARGARAARPSRGTRSRPTCSSPPFFEDMPKEPAPLTDIQGARVLGAARRLGHHRPHLAGRQHRQGQPRPRST